MIFNLKIVCSNTNGYKKNTPVKLFIEITTDKLLIARADVGGVSAQVELHPFSNSEQSAEQRYVRKAEQQANIEAEQNGGKPTKQGLEILYKAYEKVGNDFRAAETLELLNELYPSKSNYNQIGVLYSNAGHDDKALEYYKLAYENDKDATTAFNLAYKLKDKDKAKFKEILEESIRLDSEKPHSLFELGRLLKKEKDPKGKEMIQKAFEIWKKKFESNRMSESDYSWLSSAADELGMRDFAQQVRESKPIFSGEQLFNHANLTVTNKEEGLVKQ